METIWLTDNHFFHLSELAVTEQRRYVDENLQWALSHKPALVRLCVELLDPIRLFLGVSVSISSGIRCLGLNKAVGGSQLPLSAHVYGRAADLTAARFGSPVTVARAIEASSLSFDKLIYEGTWVHGQIAKVGETPRREVYTAIFAKGKKTQYIPGIHERG